MKTLYLDCFAGISGDMVIGALLDLGLDKNRLEAELQKLNLGGYHLNFHKVSKQSISAMKFDVILEGALTEHLADSEFQEIDLNDQGKKYQAGFPLRNPIAQGGHNHTHQHGHDHDHKHEPHSHPHSNDSQGTTNNPVTQRSLSEILELISNSSLPARVIEIACDIFSRLGMAEALVHGQPVEHVHLHEVGATDAIIDIVGMALGVELLGIDEVRASPLHLGSGFVKAAHGLLPIPAPATINLLKGVPVYSTDVKGELVTPTGAAFVASMVREFGALPPMKIISIGYGAGSRDRTFPNVLRAYLGETIQLPEHVPAASPHPNRNPYAEQHLAPEVNAGYHSSPAVVIEANLDDMQPQLFNSLLDHLLDANALDVTLTQAQMKKNRPGIRLQVLASPASVDSLLQIIFTESTTIGVRTYDVQKRMLQREVIDVQTRYGQVRVKLSRLGKKVVNTSPEYEDCLRLADLLNLPVKEVYSAAVAAASLS